MFDRRASGIVAHVSSLPGRYGIGDFGPAAYEFVDFLARTGQSIWQVLPIGPGGYGGSPYQSPSAFAGNEWFVSLERLFDAGRLSSASLQIGMGFSTTKVDYTRVPGWRRSCLFEASEHFAQSARTDERAQLAEFARSEAWWLDDYALFIALKEAHADVAWTAWHPDLVRRQPEALAAARAKFARRMDAERFVQFEFARQWHALRQYAAERQVRILGDVPIFVAHDSADVWAHQDLFYLAADGRPTVVAGVPPDYFSETGQLWGNPLYRWDVLAKSDYDWWVRRLAHAFRLFDAVRIDHFRGFESYWEVAGDAVDARRGRWAPGPGVALFRAIEKQLGPLALVAEDLGVITPPVEALRDEIGAPGMRVLQFAFGTDAKAADYKPHNYVRNCLAYTGTHDNDTAVGWFNTKPGVGSTRTTEEIELERRQVLDYLGTDGREIHWDLLRSAWGSVAGTAMAPLQDVLGLGSEARMNLPGTADGNWHWRFTADQLTPEIEARLALLTSVYERSPPRVDVADSAIGPNSIGPTSIVPTSADA